MAAATGATSSLVPVQPVFIESGRLALAGYPAGGDGPGKVSGEITADRIRIQS
jgi:hypothetical protein